MISSKFDPHEFFGRADHIALRVGASEVFGLLKRSLDLPASWAALVTRETGDEVVVSSGGEVSGDDVDTVLFVRTTPVEIILEESRITTRDKFLGGAKVRFRVSVIPERSELLSFRRAALGSHRVVHVERLTQQLEPAVRDALAKLAAEHPAEKLVEAAMSETVSLALTKALEASCFETGLFLEGKPDVCFDFPAFRQVQQAEEQAARLRAQQETARQLRRTMEHARNEHLEKLQSLLDRLAQLAPASPDVALPELIRTFSQQQRGQIYEALFATEQPISRTKWIVVAVSDELLFFDPADPATPARRLTITGAAGPLRSVQTVEGENGDITLLLGAARGVYRLPIDRSDPDLTLLVEPAPSVRGGFNAATVVGDRVFATHSELGLREWALAEPTDAKSRFEPMTRDAKAVRGVCRLGTDVYCSIDDRIIQWPAQGGADRPTGVFTGSGTTITALCATPSGIFAGNQNGDILYWPPGTERDPEILHHGFQRAAESVSLLCAFGVPRLVFTDTSLQVHARVVGDRFTCRYEAGGQTLRRMEVAPDLIVATNDLRDRLICWSPGKPEKPKESISVGHLCGRSVQDVCLVQQM